VRLKAGLVAAVAAALVAAGCGGSAGGNKQASGGKSIAPGSAVAYLSIDTDVDSAAWKKAQALLDRFPGKNKILSHLRSSLEDEGLDWETDVKPALGNETEAVFLDADSEHVVGLTKPKDQAKFDALLAKSTPPMVSEQVDGWTVFAEQQSFLDEFDKARSDSGSLSDDSVFGDAYGSLPSDSIARAWVRGSTLQTAFDQKLDAAGLPADTTKNQVGTLDALTAAVAPQTDGMKIASTFSGDLDIGGSTYHADLPGSLPGGAIFYLSFNGVGDRINKLIDSLGDSIPDFDRDRAQIELVLGYPLEDVFGLLDGEGGVALYPNEGGAPGVLFVAKVSDESKATSILNRLAALAAASGSLQVQSVQVGSVEAKQIDVAGTSVYAAVFDGKLVTTNNRAALEKMQGSGPKLADDSAYKTAVAQAGMPEETSGFVYADTKEALEYAFSYAEGQGATVPQIVEDNTAPLQGLLLYGSKDGGDVTLTGFLGIQ
jgi:hypothetical protein